jgi:hypothetical protein
MSHSRGFLRRRCPGNFKKYRKPVDGIQNWKCGRCGALKQTKVQPCLFGLHRMGRTRKDPTIKCRRCGALPRRA